MRKYFYCQLKGVLPDEKEKLERRREGHVPDIEVLNEKGREKLEAKES